MKAIRLISTLLLLLAVVTAGVIYPAQLATAQTGIPSGATITSATFYFYVSFPSYQTVRVHKVLSPWTESEVTWGNFNGAYDPTILGTFSSDVPWPSGGWRSVSSSDLTALVQSWVNDPTKNNGILLEEDIVKLKHTEYNSSEYTSDPTLRPKLQICYTSGGADNCVTIQRGNVSQDIVADSTLWQPFPTTNFGAEPWLITGYFYMGGYNVSGTWEKQALVRFDFSLLPPPLPAALGDFVWNDVNVNGVQDAGEVGIPNVAVNLYPCGATSAIGTTVTDSTGHYGFTGLVPGSYYAVFVKPVGYTLSPQYQGGNTALDSNASTTDGKTDCVTLVSGQTDTSVDAGMYQLAAPGTGTPGYWMNHPEAWPVASITIGGVTYDKDAAIALMKAPTAGDVTYIMFQALVAAKLNVLAGNDDSCIADTIMAADAWMATYGPVGRGVKAGGSNSPWRQGGPLYNTLDSYNNGLLPCAVHRS